VLLRFSKSRKRTVSDGFVKKSADSDSRRRHYKLIYTGHRAQWLSTGGWQIRRRFMSQVIVPGPQRRNHRPTRRAPTTMQRRYIGQRTHQAAGRDRKPPRPSTLHCPICTQTTQQRLPSVDTRRQAQTHATQRTQQVVDDMP